MNMLRNVAAWMVALTAWVIWRGSCVPMDEDDLAARFRENDGAGW